MRTIVLSCVVVGVTACGQEGGLFSVVGGFGRGGDRAAELPEVEIPTCSTDTSRLADCTPGVAAVTVSEDGAVTPYGTIQEALSTSPEEVAVCPGTHTEDTLVVSGPVWLRAASASASDTVLDGEGHRALLNVQGEVSIEHLTFRNGLSDYAGGALEAYGIIEVACSVFEGNVADYQGGAIQARGDLVVYDSEFVGNYADYEGGAISWGDGDDGSLTIVQSTFDGNDAGYEGGALDIGTWAYDTVSIQTSTFTDNADPVGNGVVNFGSWGGFDGVLQACTFDGNDQAIGLGGWLEDGFTLDVIDTTIVGDPGDAP